MNRVSAFFLLIVGLTACSKPQVAVTPEMLLEYDKNNPENKVTITTELGTIKLRLYEDTPLHRANFVRLIKEGHYERADFYRIVYGFMIQGGDKKNQLSHKIPSEFRDNYFHKKGALSMAREEDNNPEKLSSAAEFFIVQGSVYTPEEMQSEARSHKLQLTDEQQQPTHR